MKDERRQLDDDRVLTIAQWCELNHISKPTGYRLMRAGEGPPVVQVSERRFGVRVGDNRKWQESRIRAAE